MTRYPKTGRGRKWTTLELKAIRAEWAGNTLNDGGGLAGEVRASSDGSISVRFKYAFKSGGKVKWHQCGTWPSVSLEQIRTQRDAARDLLKIGVNPNDHKKAERIENQARVNAAIAEAAKDAAQNLTLS